MREVATRLGAGDVPASRSDLVACMQAARRDLDASERTREVVALLLDPPVDNAAFVPLQRMTAQAAVDLLPPWARRMHGLHASTLSRPIVHAGTVGVGGLLRWAFR
jgi:uncharacterized protein (DUF2236 family)